MSRIASIGILLLGSTFFTNASFGAPGLEQTGTPIQPSTTATQIEVPAPSVSVKARESPSQEERERQKARLEENVRTIVQYARGF